MISINLDKAKTISHELRRTARTAEFEPYDNVIAKQIPGQFDDAEAKRQEIRARYASYQEQINNAPSVEVLKEIIKFQ
jgi:hypothetical protein